MRFRVRHGMTIHIPNYEIPAYAGMTIYPLGINWGLLVKLCFKKLRSNKFKIVS